MTNDPRFAFGKNWQDYLQSVDQSHIDQATSALSDLLGRDSLEGLSFLDAGCGSGIMSLAAMKLEAQRLHAFDYDKNSVNTTNKILSTLPKDRSWVVEQGSLTDHQYLRSLGTFDVVYSWGVIHHTGEMWRVASMLPEVVRPGGTLVVAIYNDQGWRSNAWRAIKRTYVNSPSFVQSLMAFSYFLPVVLGSNIKSLMKQRRFRVRRPRGMSAWHDAVDWIGGYPFEVASREEVESFFYKQGFVTDRIISVGSKHGCNQFVFRKCS